MENMNCLFCKIVKKEIPAKIVFENDKVMAFEDINPQAPVHILVIPKKHAANIDALEEDDKEYIAAMFFAAKQIARDNGVAEDGYRCVLNTTKASPIVRF